MENKSAPLNCTPPAIFQFPSFIFTQEQRENGVIVLHVIVAAYMIICLMQICDHYFVSSLKCICEILGLQPDVAGATFMAIGTSAPEFFTAIIGTTVAKDNIGLGTMVGSAAFNLAFLIGLCALVAGTVGHLDWWPLLRDSMCYIISVIVITLMISDSLVYWYESTMLIVLYFLYILLMYMNPKITNLIKGSDVRSPEGECHRLDTKEDKNYKSTVAENTDNLTNGLVSTCDGDSLINSHLEKNTDNDAGKREDGNKSKQNKTHRETTGLNTSTTQGVYKCCNKTCHEPTIHNSYGFKHIEPTPLFEPPESCCRRLIWAIMLPMSILFFITIPDCRKTKWRQCFMLTFLMSTVWLSLLSYILVWTVTVTGYTIGVSDDVMGLVFLGPGTSVPDLMVSLIVAKEGFWDMAVSNCIGSNVFEMLLCLGVSWLISSFLPPFNVHHHTVKMLENGLTYISLMLLGTILAVNVAIVCNNYKMDRKLGVFLICCYVAFVVISVMYEMNIFGAVSLPMCTSAG
ncbi:sodium/potassium/calcium exchanger 4-like [Saccoglossus kowalevskii]|uniref:Sodium/potassium/calcium exchanger 3-like n=1 Tax=Saccoglossus kowalevskii TaxID=10224 RepID=A0ABM0LV93_SACKO|nr:PREDICTED: sodium/potassium/calcium exchanger 3-like [Saccoglossus kowalevskii]